MIWPEPTVYRLFLVTAFVVLVIPGPAVVYILTRSIDQGRLAGVVSALGLGLGNMVQAVAAALGLSVLVASSAVAFSIVKYAGAAYLIYLGIKRLREKDDLVPAEQRKRTLAQIFRQGIVVNILNPKVALFFLAFLPQFIDPALGRVALQTAILGMSFALLGIVTDSAYALVGGTLGGWLRHSVRFRRSERYVSGGIYISLGAASAFAGTQSK